MGAQPFWRWCNKCSGLFFGQTSRGTCQAGGSHDPGASGRYTTVWDGTGPHRQQGWRWCQKCQGMFFFGGGDAGRCPAGAGHDPSASGAYALLNNMPPQPGMPGWEPGQTGWRWCRKCQGLFFPTGAGGRCPADNQGHDGGSSGEYAVLLDDFGVSDPDHLWVNWEGRLSSTVAARFRPSTLDQVASIVTQAAARHIPVRAVGSSWSFSEVGMTTGYLVETNNLAAILATPFVGDAPVSPGERLVHVEAGIKIRDLYTRLDAIGLGLRTLGGSGGQSLAGVMSTGTHGGDFDRAPIADMVRAIQLVGPDGAVWWIERASQPVTTPAFVAATFPYIDPSRIKHADDWFDAVLVSMGTMGVVYSVVVAARDKYRLVQVRTQSTWNATRPRLVPGGAAFTQLPSQRFLEVVLTPNSAPSDNGDRVCVVTQRREAGPGDTDTLAPGRETVMTVLQLWPNYGPAIMLLVPPIMAIPGVGILAGTQLTVLAASSPNLVETLVGVSNIANLYGLTFLLAELTKMLMSQQMKAGTSCGPSFAIMDTYDYEMAPPKVDSLEVFFDATSPTYLDTIDALLNLIQSSGSFGGFVSLRWTAGSVAALGMQQSNLVVSAEVGLVKGIQGNEALMAAVQAFALARGGRLHWGQRNDVLGPANLNATAFPKIGQFRAVRAALTQNGALTTFDNAFTTRCGLSTAPVPTAPTSWRWCSKCQGLAYAGNPTAGACPAGGTHDHGSSGTYVLRPDSPLWAGQNQWRWCSKCQALCFGASPGPKACAGGGTHDLSRSGDYSLAINPGQPNWRWCHKCELLSFAGFQAGPCPAGGPHNLAGNYCIPFDMVAAPGQSAWFWCMKCQGLTFTQAGNFGVCAGGGTHFYQNSSNYTVVVNVAAAAGQHGWRWCRRCNGMGYNGGGGGGVCPAGGVHDYGGSGDYALLAVQDKWLWCNRCDALCYTGAAPGLCPAGGVHGFQNSPNYSVMIA